MNLLGFVLLCIINDDWNDGENELILCKLSLIQMKILNDITQNFDWIEFIFD